MNFTYKELTLLNRMIGIALMSGKIEFNEVSESVHKKVADEIVKRNSPSLSSGSGMQRGDILLKPGNHTAMHIGNGQLVEASQNEFGGITGGASGDQTGKEIWIHGYYNFPWTYVLRYPEQSKGVSLVRWIPG